MLIKMKGYAVCVDNGSLLFECNDKTYELYVSDNFVKCDEVYIYIVKNEIEDKWFGFNNIKQLQLFKKLNTISGIGPKTALKIIGYDDIDNIEKALNDADYDYIANIKGLNDKKVSDIFIKFKGKLIEKPKDSLIKALKKLGFSSTQIKVVDITKLNELSFDQQIIEAVKQIDQ